MLITKQLIQISFFFCVITPGAFHPFVSVFFFLKSLFYPLLHNFLGLPRIPVALFQLHAVIYITTDIYIFMTHLFSDN